MTFFPSDASMEPVDELTGEDAASPWWKPDWLQRRQDDQELARWVAEVKWQWSDAVDGAQLTNHSMTAGRIPLTVAPEVHEVEPGPPVTLLVRMLPGQVVEDFETQAHRLAGGLGVPVIQILSGDPGFIKVVLLDHDPQRS
ncbi:MAG: hypothetical protein ACRDSH_20700 [Pseudonocardiaceae bacterium]